MGSTFWKWFCFKSYRTTYITDSKESFGFFFRHLLFGRLRDGISGTSQWNFNYRKFGTMINCTALLWQWTLSHRDWTSHAAFSSRWCTLELASLHGARFWNCWERDQSFPIHRDLLVAFPGQLAQPSCSHRGELLMCLWLWGLVALGRSSCRMRWDVQQAIPTEG